MVCSPAIRVPREKSGGSGGFRIQSPSAAARLPRTLAAMNDNELQTLVDAWVPGTDSGHGSPEHKNHWWAIEKIMECPYDGNHELLWRFVRCVYKRELSDRVIANLAAGPLEDLIFKFGPIYIEQIETLAKEDNRFNYLLGGVWQNFADKEIWDRVQKVRRETW